MPQFVRLVLIAAVACNGYGGVLCFGSDGHVAIEPVFHDHCSQDHEHGHHHSDADRGEGSGGFLTASCEPCTDVMVAADFEPVRIKNLSQSIFVHAGIDLTTIAVCFDRDCCGAHTESFSYFTPLKTIILLT